MSDCEGPRTCISNPILRTLLKGLGFKQRPTSWPSSNIYGANKDSIDVCLFYNTSWPLWHIPRLGRLAFHCQQNSQFHWLPGCPVCQVPKEESTAPHPQFTCICRPATAHIVSSFAFLLILAQWHAARYSCRLAGPSQLSADPWPLVTGPRTPEPLTPRWGFAQQLRLHFKSSHFGMWDLIALATQHGGMWVLKSGPKKGFSLRRKNSGKGVRV